MKKILSILILVTSLFGCSQSKKVEPKQQDNNMNLKEVIINELISNPTAYQQFIDLARCNCMDYLEEKKGNKTDLYIDLYDSLQELNQIITILLASSYYKYLKTYLDNSLENRIHSTVFTLKKQDEYFSDNRSSYLICYKAYKNSDNFTKKLYSDFLLNTNIVDKKIDDFFGKDYDVKSYEPFYNENEY